MVQHYVTKAHSQHTSVVTSIPKPVQKALGLASGDHLVWQVDSETFFVQLSNLIVQGDKHDRGTKHSDQKDQGGRL